MHKCFAVAPWLAALVAAGCTGTAPEVLPATPGFAHGDCRKMPAYGLPSLLFTPADSSTSDGPGATLLASGGYLYSALLSSDDNGLAGPLMIYGGPSSGGGAFLPFTTISHDKEFEFGPLPGRDHLYWWQTQLPPGELAPDPSITSLAYRSGDGSQVTVPGVSLLLATRTFAIDGDDVFSFFCTALGGVGNCGTSSAPWKVTATRLDTGATSWSTTIAADAIHPYSPVVTDDAALYWHSTAPADGSGPQRILTMPRTGGTPTEVPTPLQPGESVRAMARHADGLTLVALGPRDLAVTDEVILYRVPLPVGSAPPTRASLGRTSLEGLNVAFDDASVYFTVDASAPSGDYSMDTRTLERACLDGSAVTPLLVGARFGRYSMQQLALDDASVYFTANNGIYALGK